MHVRIAVLVLATTAIAHAGDLCREVGYSGRTANTVSCTSTRDARTITCAPGYYAVYPDNPSITLAGDRPFGGCIRIHHCKTYGFSGRTENTQSCTETATGRVIACKTGYVPATIELAGNAPFEGCTLAPVTSAPRTMRPMSKQAALADACQRFGYSGKDANAQACKPIDGGRVITCAVGYVPVPNADLDGASITLMADKPFPGCRMVSMCKVYGYSNNAQNVLSCTDSANARTIRCKPEFFPAGSKTDSITLVGNAAFPGCRAKPL